MITWKRPRHRGRHAAAAVAATALVPAALFALPVVERPSLEPFAALLASLRSAQEPAVLWITAGDEYRIGRPGAPVVPEEQLDGVLAAMRTGDRGSGTLVVRSDSARVGAPGTGYSAIIAGNAACRAGFAVVRYELVKRHAGSAEPVRLRVTERRLAPPCEGSSATDTLPGPRPARAPAADAGPAATPAAAALAARAGTLGRDTIPDDRVFVELGKLDQQPAVANAREMLALMARIYPEALREAGVGGQVVASFEVRVDGTVDTSTIDLTSATDRRLVDPTRQVVGQLRFRPGSLAGEAVRTRVHVPITWRPAGTPTAPGAPAAGATLPAAAAKEAPQAPALRIRGYNVPAVRPAMADSARGYARQAAPATPAPPAAERAPALITGTVWSATGAPLPGVSVTDVGAERAAITDAAGRYALQVGAGTHEVIASRVGYLASTERVTAREGQTTTLDFTLAIAAAELQGVVAVGYGAVRRGEVNAPASFPQGTISGRVLDAGGRPIAGASVVIPGLTLGAVSNEQGRFSLRVPAGEVEVHVLAPGAPRSEIRVVTVPAGPAPVPVEVTIPDR
jgi:TonB family protein